MYAFPLAGRGGDSSGPVVGRYEWVPRWTPHPFPLYPIPTLLTPKMWQRFN